MYEQILCILSNVCEHIIDHMSNGKRDLHTCILQKDLKSNESLVHMEANGVVFLFLCHVGQFLRMEVAYPFLSTQTSTKVFESCGLTGKSYVRPDHIKLTFFLYKICSVRLVLWNGCLVVF